MNKRNLTEGEKEYLRMQLSDRDTNQTVDEIVARALPHLAETIREYLESLEGEK